MSVEVTSPPDPNVNCNHHRHSKYTVRRQHVENTLLPQLKRMGFDSAEIFKAVTEEDFTWKDGIISWKSLHFDIGPGIPGNFISHYALWDICVALNSALLILEDDALLPQTSEADVREAIDQYDKLPDTGSILYLQSQVPYLPNSIKSYHSSTFAYQCGSLVGLGTCSDMAGTAAYCIRPKAASVLMARALALGTNPTDCFIHTAFNERAIGVLVSTKSAFLLHEHWAAWNH